MKRWIPLGFVLLLSLACSTTKAPAAATVDGTYQLDTDVLRVKLTTSDDPTFKSAPPEALDQVVNGMKDFKFEIKGLDVTATFGVTVVKGTIARNGGTDVEPSYLMTPTDEDKKKDPVTLVFKDNSLTLDPGKRDIDKLYFKRAAAK